MKKFVKVCNLKPTFNCDWKISNMPFRNKRLAKNRLKNVKIEIAMDRRASSLMCWENVFLQNVKFYFKELRGIKGQYEEDQCRFHRNQPNYAFKISVNRIKLLLLTALIVFSNCSESIPISTLAISFPARKTMKRLRIENFSRRNCKFPMVMFWFNAMEHENISLVYVLTLLLINF